jgi:hypothetical protein
VGEAEKKVELKADQMKDEQRKSTLSAKRGYGWNPNYAEPELYRSVGFEELDSNGYSLSLADISVCGRDTTIDYHRY